MSLESSRFMGHIFGIVFKLQYLYSSKKTVCAMQVPRFYCRSAAEQINSLLKLIKWFYFESITCIVNITDMMCIYI